MIIAVSGKGGTGKTLVSSLLIKSLTSTGKDILAIDADPDSNLPEALGVDVHKTVGDVREELKEDTAKGRIPTGMNKWDILDYKIMESIIETPSFDLLVMGRPEGSGCYCAVNNMLRRIIENLSSNYDVIIIDTEAGLEHLSRRTTQNVDVMLVVTDKSKRGMLTAQRIGQLADELEIKFQELYLVVNRVNPENEEQILKKARETGLDIAGVIFEDEEVTQYDIEGRPLVELPDESNTVKTVSGILSRIRK
ncbi:MULTISPECIES: AAA family ATPase [Methanobacterium]|uniref:AAA family ATPase n=1 Tax=Methanobacterium formicicum TaxID=2162 RepID=A0A089Z9Y4_METFO|nr:MULTISPECIES: AAA family ATPase [Methanobacterium]AIS31616.1 CO dehydrogenase/acetyl-CoA synthase accessory protein [Methanobacterium formicicum]KUK75566.1 MAG: Cobyrinic acid ac-diamide synthase [Methanobacterium sp. 42_16]MBF4475835.1 AAA family ATPase [Methanobacterium formicicum]MDD4810431.1 AAA family ATPase [Methanobacterium formicicum]CEL25479.1 putative ATP-binding protein MJ0685 [Methanobacterium formicicum]